MTKQTYTIAGEIIEIPGHVKTLSRMFLESEIVDVLKELLAIHPKATEGAMYGCNQACLRIAKDLGISLED